MTIKPIKEHSPEELRHYLHEMQGFIILMREPGHNSYTGYVENSFSMGGHKDRVRLYWTNHDHWFGRIDGEEDATAEAERLRKAHPDIEFEVWDARDPKCPVTVDWADYAESNRYNPNTLSGVSNKFNARNIPFAIKEMQEE